MLDFVAYLINEVNGTNTLKKAVNAIKKDSAESIEKTFE